MSSWQLRGKELLGSYLPVVVGVLVVIAALGGWLTYTAHVEPGTHEETRVVGTWEEEAAFTHRATVDEPNPLYGVNATLHNRSAYFPAISPVMNGSFRYGYTANEGGNLTVKVQTAFVLQAVDRTGSEDDRTVLWQRTKPLGAEQTTGLSPGEQVTVPFATNLSAARNLTERIRDSLRGGAGTTQALIRTRVSTTGTVDGERVERTRTYTLPLELGTAVRVGNTGPFVDRHERTETVVVPNEPGPFQRLGGVGLLAGSVLLIGSVGVLSTRGEFAMTSVEREYLTYHEDRSEFDEWITDIRPPAGTKDLPRAEANSLQDLVDFAIDTNNGVMRCPEDGSYYVVHDDCQYVYDPPTEPGGGESAEFDDEPDELDEPGEPDVREGT